MPALESIFVNKNEPAELRLRAIKQWGAWVKAPFRVRGAQKTRRKLRRSDQIG